MTARKKAGRAAQAKPAAARPRAGQGEPRVGPHTICLRCDMYVLEEHPQCSGCRGADRLVQCNGRCIACVEGVAAARAYVEESTGSRPAPRAPQRKRRARK